MHDPKVYSDPMTFNPERFLGPNMEQDPRDIGFGFGRRYVDIWLVPLFLWNRDL